MRCFPTQAFARPEVELFDKRCDIAVRRQGDIKRFWQILSEQIHWCFHLYPAALEYVDLESKMANRQAHLLHSCA